MVRVVVCSADEPARQLFEVPEEELGHVTVLAGDVELGHVVIRSFRDRVEVAVADSSWEWLARTAMPLALVLVGV